MSTKDILNAIISGQNVDAEAALNDVMMSKIADRFSELKQELAPSFFSSKTSEVNEKLASDATASDYIKDFIESDDPRFEGKSKEERRKMALGAFYSNQKK
jgi:hypothetical protein